MDTEQRELYFRKLEDFLSLKLAGKLEPAALARKELELDQLKGVLEQRVARAEQDLAARRAALETDLAQARRELETAADEKARALEQSYAVKSRALEQEHLMKMLEAREKELLARAEQKALEERQAHFQEYYAAQRAELQAQLKHFRDEIEGEVRLRTELAERVLEQRQASLESGWRRERELLLRELESWKLKAQEQAPRLIELERDLAAAQEAARQARAAADTKTLVFAEQTRGLDALKAIWDQERALLIAELERWRSGALPGGPHRPNAD